MAMNNFNQKSEWKPFEGYWKDDPNLKLATFSPDKSNIYKGKETNANIANLAEMDEDTKKRAIDAGRAAAKTVSAALFGSKDIYPERTVQSPEGVKPEFANYGVDRAAEYAEAEKAWKAVNTYPARAKVTVELAKKDGVVTLKNDKTPMLSVKAEISEGDSYLTFNLSENGKEIRSINARERMEIEGKNTAQRFNQEEIADSTINDTLKKIATAVIDGGFIKEKDPYVPHEKGVTNKQMLFNLSEALRKASGAVKNGEDWNYDNATASVRYNKEGEKNGVQYPASVSVMCPEEGKTYADRVEGDRFLDISVSMRGHSVNTRYNTLVIDAAGKLQPETDKAEYIKSPAELDEAFFAFGAKEIQNVINEAMGFNEPMYELSEQLKQDDRFKDTMPSKDGDVPAVIISYNSGNNTIYVKDRLGKEDNSIEINENGDVPMTTKTTNEKGETAYKTAAVDASKLEGVYKDAVDAVKESIVKEKADKNIERD